MRASVLSTDDIEQFIENGFVPLRHVVPADVLATGLDVIWTDLDQGPDDPSSWTDPVARLLPSDARPFRDAFDRSRLSMAFDQLVGIGHWLPRTDLGLFVVRFPHAADPGDTGWHIDTSFPPDDGPTEDYLRWRVNVASRDRALLMLFLYSEVGPDDAPTRLRVGSHLDVAAVLAPAGTDGRSGLEASVLAAEATTSRPVALATGDPGDVYLCHPFLVHAAQSVRGNTPRVMAQPPLATNGPFVLDGPGDGCPPVESAIRRGLETGGPEGELGGGRVVEVTSPQAGGDEQ